MTLLHITGDITEQNLDVIVHQTNTVLRGVNKAKGLAKVLFDRFPYSNVYREASATTEPGAILVRKPRGHPHNPIVVGINGQTTLGRSRSVKEKQERLRYFQTGLVKLLPVLQELSAQGGTA
ncbi:hypothetical protein GEMRC1_011419 [Eukaryota sp. GEM-RC1]